MPTENNSNIKMADILIVDDEIANLKLLAEILDGQGYRVRPADSPKLAIDSAFENPPDLILLDVRMPDMDGFEVCDILKKDDRTCDIPIIFISALHGTKDKVRGFEAGGVDFISKPFQDEEILARVRTHLKLYNLQRNLEEIVARRTAELAESEQLARSLLNATTDVTHLIDEEGTILDLNEAMAAKLGKTREELIGTCVFDYFPPEAAEARREIVRQAFVEGRPFRYKDRHHPGIVFDTGIYPIKTPAGEKDRIVIFAHDISDLEKSRQEVVAVNKKMQLAADSAQFGIWGFDVKNKRLEWDDRMLRLYGVRPDNVSGTLEAWQTVVHPDDWERCLQEIAQALSGEKVFDTEFRVVRPDGQVRYVKAHAIVSRDSQGNPIQMTGVNYDITRERQAEESLHQKVKQMRTILDTVPAYIFAKDIDGRFLLANKAVADVFGIDPEDVVGKTDLDYGATPEQTREYNTADRSVIESQKSFLIPEEQVMRKDGTLGWFQTTKIPYHHPGYDKPAILGVAVEITKRKRAEQDLQKSRDYLEHLINSIPDAVFSVKLPERTIEWARDSYNVLGHNLEEFIGKNTVDLYSSVDEYLAINEILKCAIRDNRDSFTAEPILRNKKGDLVPVETKSTIYRDKGEPVSVISLVRDISDRKKYQEELKKSEALLKEAQRIARIGNWELNHLTGALTWSDEVFSIFEINPAYFGGKYDGFLDAIHPDDRDMVNAAYTKSLKNNEPYGIDHRLLTPDGRIKYVHEQCETAYSPEGKPLRSVGTVQDITERKKIEKELKKAQTETINLRLDMAHLNRIMTMNEFAASFAHEINQPLGAIINNATVARSMNTRLSEKNEEMDEILDDISQDAMLAGKIIRKIRTVMKKGEAVFTPLSVNLMLDEVIALYRNTFTLEYIRIEVQKDQDPVTVKGDLLRLQQVLMNLITNAIDAMQNCSEKVIKFKTFQSDGMVNVSISDTGSGIETNKTDKLFDPFYTTKKEGMGIGLRLCRSIIEEHGGRIWFENNPGPGATFNFSLKIFSEG